MILDKQELFLKELNKQMIKHEDYLYKSSFIFFQKIQQ